MNTKDLINRLRDTASKGVSVWGDLQIEAAKEIETLVAERECYASAMDRMKAALAEPSEPVEKHCVNCAAFGGCHPNNDAGRCGYEPEDDTNSAPSNHLDEIAKVLHYPDCWDTAAYPTLEDAIIEAKSWTHCTNEDCQCPTKEAT